MRKVAASEFPCGRDPFANRVGMPMKHWGILAVRFPPFVVAKRGWMRHRVRQVIVRSSPAAHGGEYSVTYACGNVSNNVHLTDDPDFICATDVCATCEGRVWKWQQEGWPCGREVAPAMPPKWKRTA